MRVSLDPTLRKDVNKRVCVKKIELAALRYESISFCCGGLRGFGAIATSSLFFLNISFAE